jgi:hypothetical protein
MMRRILSSLHRLDSVIAVFCIGSACPSADAQALNYNKSRRDIITASCGTTSLEDVRQNLAALSAIDPERISKGRERYHYDVAMLRYKEFALTSDTASLRHAIAAFGRTLREKADFYPAWQGLAICHYLRADCAEVKRAAAGYASCAPRRAQDDPSIRDILDACRNTP